MRRERAVLAAPAPAGASDHFADHFAILGLPRRQGIDLAEAEARYRELARQNHPDRFARGEPAERRAAMLRTAALNEAWRVLRDPFRRAEYLLSLSRGAGAGEPTMPPAFLAEMLEQREVLGDALLAGDRKAVAALSADMRRRSSEAMARVARRFDGEEGADLGETARDLAAVRYYKRFLEQAEDAGAEDGAGGGLAAGGR